MPVDAEKQEKKMMKKCHPYILLCHPYILLCHPYILLSTTVLSDTWLAVDNKTRIKLI